MLSANGQQAPCWVGAAAAAPRLRRCRRSLAHSSSRRAPPARQTVGPLQHTRPPRRCSVGASAELPTRDSIAHSPTTQVLLDRGFAFCDEGEPEAPPSLFGEPPPELDEGREEALLGEGVDASSTDAPQQGVSCTLQPDPASFWSSTGSQSPDASEFLLYKMR